MPVNNALLPSDIPSLEGQYLTPPGREGLLARISPSLSFYPRMTRVVLQAARLARQGRYDNKAWIKSSMDIVRALEKAGVRLSIVNSAAFRGLSEPCVFIGNHMSTLETFVLPCIIRPHRPLTFVVKKSLVEYPVFKHIMISRDPVVVGRTNPREDLKSVLEGGEARLSRGVSIVVFPQSTRSTGFDPAQFNSIGIKLARRANAPVVPLALKTDAWGNGRLLKEFGPIDPGKTVHIEFGNPLTVSGNGKQEHAAISEFIAGRLEKWSFGRSI